MESLALLVALIFVVMIFCTFGSIAFALIPRTWSRVVATVMAVPTVALGTWLVVLQIGVGARVIGGIVLVLGLVSAGWAIRGLVRAHRMRVSSSGAAL